VPHVRAGVKDLYWPIRVLRLHTQVASFGRTCWVQRADGKSYEPAFSLFLTGGVVRLPGSVPLEGRFSCVGLIGV
jgi:hypothetical protein